jgi:hypothetical protein
MGSYTYYAYTSYQWAGIIAKGDVKIGGKTYSFDTKYGRQK